MKNRLDLFNDNMEKLGPLGQALECSVCLDLLNTSSRVLPCQHTFCESCLINIINSHKELRCPECRVLVTVPLQDLPSNILLMRVLESIKKLPQRNLTDISKPFSENNPKVSPTFVKRSSTSSTKNNEMSIQTNSICETNPFTINGKSFSYPKIGRNDASSLPQMVHNLIEDSPSKIVLNEPISDGSYIEHSDPIDFFPTNFSSGVVDGAGSVKSATTSMEVLTKSTKFDTMPRIIANDSSLVVNDQFNSAALSLVGPCKGANSAPTSIALIEQRVPSFVKNINEICERRRKSINLPTSTSNTLSCSNLKEDRSSLSEIYTSKNKDFVNIVATALFTYSQKEFWGLSFKKGDVISIIQKVDDNWYQGKLNGQIGFIPSSYVKVEHCSINFPQCMALFDFEMATENRDGLSFHKGDVITVLRRVDENWAEGKFNSKIGIFPLSFVKMNEAAKSVLNLSPKCSDEALITEKIIEVKSASESKPEPSINLIDIGPKPFSQNTSGENQNNVYECIHPYNPSKGDELQLNKGSFYVVSQKCQDGWFKGRCLVTDKVGVFPGNYLSSSSDTKVKSNFTLQEREYSKNITSNSFLVNDFNSCSLSPNHCSNSSPRYSSSKDLPGSSVNVIHTSDFIRKFKIANHSIVKIEKKDKGRDSKIFKQPAPLMRERYRCGVPYPPSNPDELELRVGDVVYVHRKMDNGWCKGTLQRTGESGLFPSTFVEPY